MRLRTFAAAGVLLLAAHAAFADNPSGRVETRMAFDPTSGRVILYGGASPVDGATRIAFDLDDTWQWNGFTWVRIYPAHTPGARSAHVMVLDSTRNRIVVFGGKRTDTSSSKGPQTALNDTWAFANGDWSQIDAPNAPSPRIMAGAAYDPDRDRIVLFGGESISTDGKNTTANLYDTWEFDGTTWTQRGGEGPKVNKPTVVYDQANKQTLLLGLDENSSSKSATLMYRYDAANGTWVQLTPTGLPDCVNESQVTFDPTRNRVVLTGGVCNSSSVADVTYEWDGTQWTKVDTKVAVDRVFGGGFAYDPVHHNDVLYGGTIAFSNVRSATFVYQNGDWQQRADASAPNPRSMSAFWFDPHTNRLMLYGGLETSQEFFDFWSYANSTWTPSLITGTPAACGSPEATFDTARQRLVMICDSSDVWEFDGAAWTQHKAADQKTKPSIRRLAAAAYDETLKKTVYFGGFDDASANFLNETWLWDGTSWSRVKKNLPPYRAQAAMWYDQTLKKTVVYGGIGRTDPQGRVERFSDMWSFDGTGWTELHPSTTPGPRYSTTYAVDPRDGHVLLFGGVYYTKDAQTAVEHQQYMNDLWEWDGTNWKQLQTTGNPPPRENAGFVFDPNTGKMTLFGGYAAVYFGDVWTFDRTTNTWQVRLDSTNGPMRRRPLQPPAPPAAGGQLTIARQ